MNPLLHLKIPFFVESLLEPADSQVSFKADSENVLKFSTLTKILTLSGNTTMMIYDLFFGWRMDGGLGVGAA